MLLEAGVLTVEKQTVGCVLKRRSLQVFCRKCYRDGEANSRVEKRRVSLIRGWCWQWRVSYGFAVQICRNCYRDREANIRGKK